MAARLRSLGKRAPVAEVRHLGGMVAMELPMSRRAAGGRAHQGGHCTRARERPHRAPCSVYSNVLRFLVPLTASDAVVNESLDILKRSLVEVVARRAT
jgi:4-aminobutyrate aminotransferase / (S)-3-amino-2-methylpropionate transaminase / 5-aminovalerate transaminase